MSNSTNRDRDDEVETSKNRLMAALGESASLYLANLKLWFCKKYTKEEFDIESRKLFTVDQIHLHNRFLLAILNKLDNLRTNYLPAAPTEIIPPLEKVAGTTSSRKRSKRSERRTGMERATFEPADMYEYLPKETSDFIMPPTIRNDLSPQPVPPQRFSVQELFLPDVSVVMGRLLVCAWELGLKSSEDSASEMIVLGVQIFLKNILSALLVKKKQCRWTANGNFFYDVGYTIKDPFIRNTVTRYPVDDAPIEMDKDITVPDMNRKMNYDVAFSNACEEIYPVRRRRITLIDLYKALQDKNIIMSHSVYITNLERISLMLNK